MMRLAPFGDDATSIDTTASTPAASARRSARVRRALLRAMPGVDVVAGGDRVLVLAPTAVVAAAAAHLDLEHPDTDDAPGETHVIDVAYDGADLTEVASRAGLTVERVIAAHAEREYAVEVVGFLPGFGYLGEVAPPLRTPRRATPRARVPAGSVAIAGRYTGIYPFASPGGWSLLGRALDPSLFDPARDPPARFAPGDRVRFRPSSAATPDAQPGGRVARSPAGGALEIVRITPHATIQDLGRVGMRGAGVPASGAWDRGTHVRANRAVGNADTCATLELPFGGVVAIARRPLVWSVDGDPPRLAAEHDRIEVGSAGRALRYLAVAGGFDVPPVLGSRSTLVAAGLGGLEGRRVARGDVLSILPHDARSSSAAPTPGEPPPPVLAVRAARGPELDDLPAGVVDALFGATWRLTSRLDRTGARLDGPLVPHAQAPDRSPRPVLPGAVQITPDGTPILLGPDAAVTGGYAVALVIGEEARDAVARLQPGEQLRFVE